MAERNWGEGRRGPGTATEKYGPGQGQAQWIRIRGPAPSPRGEALPADQWAGRLGIGLGGEVGPKALSG